MTEKKKMGSRTGLKCNHSSSNCCRTGSVHDELQNKLFCKNYWY